MAETMRTRPELLSPAGSPEALDAAIEAGADAVYLGLPSFNARINARNFTPADIAADIDRAHAYGVKVYITLNTLIFDRETDEFLRAAESAYLGGADALIVADLGGAALLRRRMPELPLHASTQLACHNIGAAQKLAELGFTRMVCAREMSRTDLRRFTEKSPIEAEVFVHGALCMSQSGGCLFSSMVGGRSGNRGECAQPCRLPYRVPKGRNEYPLSPKDLSLARYAAELIDMGVASFKIEGRMKSPEYVRDVTRVWRTLIDEHRGATDDEMRHLSEIFSRGGFTDAYYTKKVGSDMLGVRSENDKRSSARLEPFVGLKRRVPISMKLSIKRGRPSSLCIMPHNVTVFGAVPEEAINRPLDAASVAANISKLGGTPYTAKSVDVELDDGLIMPVSAVNALRRAAVSALSRNTRSEADLVALDIPSFASQNGEYRRRTAMFYLPESIPDSAYGFFDLIYTPLESYDGRCDGVAMPPVVFDSEADEVREMLRVAVKKGAKHALVGNIGHISLALDAGLVPHGDFRLNITNSHSAAQAEKLGLKDIVLSPELSLPKLRDIGGRSLAVVYGRLPLMTTEKCLASEISDCRSCKGNAVRLTDRRGVGFPVLRVWKHRNVILNSVPVYMADRADSLKANGVSGEHFIFTVEGRDEAARVIEAYVKHTAPGTEIRRIAQK
ncbi:MAG: DUF3656 domain-containing protein [Eubacteriales bacterium]